MKFFAPILLLLAIFSCKDCLSAQLFYPGGGFPIISKNKPINKLNNEMLSALKDVSGLSFENDKIHLQKITKPIEFVSQHNLPAKNFGLEFNANIKSGEIVVVFENIKIIVYPDNALIYENEELVKKVWVTCQNVALGRGYDLENKIGTTTWVCGRGAHVALKYPSSISVLIAPGTQGVLGPWEWRRGSK